jgi:PTH1 family peptidyl-tRNA hydrolase
MALDEILRRYDFARPRKRFHGLFTEGRIGAEKVLALKPLTYMNHSGRAVRAALRFYKLPLDQVVVFHDDLDLAPGKLKVKSGGGNAGHNGLKDIDPQIGRGYRRVRLGIGHPGDRHRVLSYVLKDFGRAERERLDSLIEAVAEAAPLLVKGDDPGFMTRVALILNPPRPKPPPERPQTPTVP